jgi:hypothetical protein
MTNANYLLAIGSLLFTLAGCGGGGGSDDGETNVEKSIGGIWSGNVSSIDGTNPVQSIGVVAENGRFFFFSSLEFDVGTFVTSESSFTSNVKAYVTDTETFATVNGVISGSFIEREQISGTSRFEDGTPGSTFLYNYDPTYETPSSLSSIAGIYSRSNEQETYTETYTIDATGLVTGSDTEGCITNGVLTLIDSRYTVYEIQLTISVCAADQNISGLAAYQSGGENGSDSLIIGGDYGNAPFIGAFIRQ